jgi:hypothetical protein
VHAIEAKKAGIERSRALRIPNPPLETGRDAWAQVSSLMQTLLIFSRADRISRSKSFNNCGIFQEGEHRRRYVSFGIEKQFFKRKRPV